MEKAKIEILLLEDDLAEAGLIREMLAQSRKQEFSMEHVQYLADGLALLKKRSFDCILVDLGLPDSQGLETALAVRNQAKLTPVGIVTILDDEELALKALQMDIQDYLIKGEITDTLLVRSIWYAIERKRVAEELRESEQRFASFMLHLPAAAWMKDLHGRYTYANAEAERIFSMPLTALQGKTDGEIFPPETARQFRENDERVLAEGGSLRTTEILRQANGIGHHFIVSKFTVPGPDGRPAYVAGVAFDITELKRVEEALRESEERFRVTFNQAAVGISHVAPDGRWMRINRKLCEIVGYPEEELRKLTFRDITHPGDLETSIKQFQLLLERKLESYSLKKRYIRKDGSTVWANLTASIVADASGKPRFVVGVIEDITSRKRAEEEIERLNTELAARAAELEVANRELEAFNYTVAHDLRKPLTVVNSYCQVIQELCGDKLDAQCQGYIREAYEGTMRMNRLIEALLNLSRLAHVELHRETVDLSAMAHEVAAELKLDEPGRRVTFRIGEGIMVNGDANLLRVVLDNLLGNAWKYTGMREEALIEFGVNDIDGQPACFVRDNGTGFDMEEAEKLFLPFQRLPGAEEFKGFGIGLATVERIIRRHGGRVWAEGGPGKGATFYFTLP